MDARNPLIVRILGLIFGVCLMTSLFGQSEQDYTFYHSQVIQAEKHMVSAQYGEALDILEALISRYDFVFLRDIKVAAQLALATGNDSRAIELIRLGIENGWTLKGVRKNPYLTPLRESEQWQLVEQDFEEMRSSYLNKLNLEVQKEMKQLFQEDRRGAFRAFLRITSDGQDRHTERKFAPGATRRVQRIMEITQGHGYPGERTTGRPIYSWGILSHYNSISTEFNSQDTLFPAFRPYLIEAIRTGHMYPYFFANVEDWYLAVKSDRKGPTYGYLNEVKSTELQKTNDLRSAIGMRPVELRNELVKVQQDTGIILYLSGDPWVDGEIPIKD